MAGEMSRCPHQGPGGGNHPLEQPPSHICDLAWKGPHRGWTRKIPNLRASPHQSTCRSGSRHMGPGVTCVACRCLSVSVWLGLGTGAVSCSRAWLPTLAALWSM